MKTICEMIENPSYEAPQEVLETMTDSELITLLQGNNDITSVANILDTISYSATEVIFS